MRIGIVGAGAIGLTFAAALAAAHDVLVLARRPQIAALLERDRRVTRKPVTPDEVFGQAELISADGDLRTLPLHLPDAEPRWGGLDGFYAARLGRSA